ncbi:MAG: MFS transporter [Actinobacteria bacterium]|nr:MFS transporter [Actinomycetota bacterium]
MSRETEREGSQGGLRALWGSGGFRRLLVAQGVSGLGDWVATLAFIALAFDLTRSQAAVAVVLVLRLVPPIFAAPIGGLVADRFDRRAVLIACDLSRAGLIVVAPFVSIGWIYTIAFVHESITLFFLPARDAMVPTLVSREGLPLANGLVLASSMGSIPVAAALFGGLRLLAERIPDWAPAAATIRAHPTAFAFFFDALTFTFSAAMIAGLPARVARGPAEERPGGVFEGVTEGFRRGWRSPLLRSLAIGLSVSMFGGGVLFAIGIAYVRQTLGGGDAEFGWLAALWGAGMGLGIGVVRTLIRERGEAYVFVSAVAVCGGILVVMAFLTWLWLAFAVAVAFGAAFSVAIMVALSMAQREVEDRIRGRIMAAVQMLFRVGLGAGALGMGAIATSIDRIRLGVTLDGNQLGLLIGGALILVGAAASAGMLGVATGERAPSAPG